MTCPITLNPTVKYLLMIPPYFLIEDDGLLEKYNTIWDKVSTDIKKKLIASLSLIKYKFL